MKRTDKVPALVELALGLRRQILDEGTVSVACCAGALKEVMERDREGVT